MKKTEDLRIYTKLIKKYSKEFGLTEEGVKNYDIILLIAEKLNMDVTFSKNPKSYRKWVLDLYDKGTIDILDFSADNFYATNKWKELRKRVLEIYGRKCMCCGSKRNIHVDHIKPRSKFPELELTFDNLQILCNQCNSRKSNFDETDYRTEQHKIDAYDPDWIEYQRLKEKFKDHDIRNKF